MLAMYPRSTLKTLLDLVKCLLQQIWTRKPLEAAWGEVRQTDIRHANVSGADRPPERFLNLHQEFLQNQTSAYQSRPFINNTPSKPPSTKVFLRPLSAELNSKTERKMSRSTFPAAFRRKKSKNGGWACVTGPELQESTLLGIRLSNQSYLSTFKTIQIARSEMFVVCRIICVCSHQTVGTPRCTLAASGVPSGGAKVESLFVYRFSLSLNSSLAGDLAYFPPVASFTPPPPNPRSSSSSSLYIHERHPSSQQQSTRTKKD